MKQKLSQPNRSWWPQFSWVECGLAGIALVLFVRSLLPLLHTGFPATHDGEGHVARLANYAVALRQGQLPPRMAPTFWNGYGYPIFNFHYPLLSMLGAPLVLVGIHPELALISWVAVAWVAAVAGIGALGWFLTHQRAAGLVAMILFLLNPYFYTLVYVRGSYGELLGIAAFIWLLIVIEWRSQRLNWSSSLTSFSTGAIIVLSALVLLAHNIYATALFPVAGLYALARRQQRSLWQIVAEFGLGFSVTAFFWIPALLEKKYVVFDAQFSEFYKNHFVAWWQLLAATSTFGVSTTGIEDTLSLGMGWASWVVLVLGVGYLLLATWGFKLLALKSQPKAVLLQPLILLVGLTAGCIVLMLSLSQPLWQYSFILPYYQFPWRLLGFISVILAILGGYLWSMNYRLIQFVIGVAVVINLVIVSHWYWPTYSHFAAEYYLNYYQTSTIYDELRAKTFQVAPGELSPGQPQLQGSAEISNVKWRGSYRTYDVTTSEDVTVVEPTMYFPGWQVWANGTSVELISEKTAPDLATTYKGQVAFTLPAGTWHIDSRMTQQTPARLVGNSLSLAGLLVTIGLLGKAFIRQRYTRRRPV